MAFAVIPALPFGTTVNAIFPEKIFCLVKYLVDVYATATILFLQTFAVSFLSLRAHGFSGRNSSKDRRCCKVEWER